MTSTKEIPSIQYTIPAFNRAERALSCSPFLLALLVAMQNQSVPLGAIALYNGIQQGYTRKALSESRVESELMWLISVGILRREVDGQGITDSFRLTPLGRQIVDKWEKQGELPQPSLWERLANAINRWLRLPF
jgi:hypothetical protein